MADILPFRKATVAKVDEGLGLVFGWAIVCTEKGEPYYDLQGDFIPEDVMLEGVSDFMKSARASKDMHKGSQVGVIVHSMPLTKDIAEAFGVQTEKTGWMVAMQPDSAAMLKQFRDGERTGFSIGGFSAYELEEAA